MMRVIPVREDALARLMRVVYLWLIVIALFTVAVAAFAEPPKFNILDKEPWSKEVQPGQVLTFHLQYLQAAGDPPKSLKMVVEPPTGEPINVQPNPTTDKDPVKGIDLTWTYIPINTGKYKFHFETVSATGESARLPLSESDQFEFVSSSVAIKYIILGVGLIIALGFVPFVVYAATRSINKKSDPSAAARIAILIGILASYALFIYLFFNFYQWLGVGIGAVAALAIIVAIFTRRR